MHSQLIIGVVLFILYMSRTRSSETINMEVKVTSGLRLDVYKSVHGSPKRISPFGMSVELVKVRISGIASYKRNCVMQLRIVMCFFWPVHLRL